MSKEEKFQKIMNFMCEDYKSYNISEISKGAKIGWESARRNIKLLMKIGIVTIDKSYGEGFIKYYHWNTVPLGFFIKYKEDKEKYIESLEQRLFELKYKGIIKQ